VTKTKYDMIGTQSVPTSQALSNITTYNALDCSTYIGLAIQIYLTQTSATGAAHLVEVLTSSDGTNYDSEAYCAVPVPIAAAMRQLTFAIPYIEDVKFLKLRISNNCTAAAVGVWASYVAVTP
jgi:hypothetical protein